MADARKTINFAFMTASSGNLERLQQRLGKDSLQDVADLAIGYYALYCPGEYNNGQELVMLDRTRQEAESLNDEPTPDHKQAGQLEINIDAELIEELTTLSGNSNDADTLTRAFILIEDICDEKEKGLVLAMMDEDAEEVTILQLKDHDVPNTTASAPLPYSKNTLH